MAGTGGWSSPLGCFHALRFVLTFSFARLALRTTGPEYSLSFCYNNCMNGAVGIPRQHVPITEYRFSLVDPVPSVTCQKPDYDLSDRTFKLPFISFQ